MSRARRRRRYRARRHRRSYRPFLGPHNNYLAAPPQTPLSWCLTTYRGEVVRVPLLRAPGPGPWVLSERDLEALHHPPTTSADALRVLHAPLLARQGKL